MVQKIEENLNNFLFSYCKSNEAFDNKFPVHPIIHINIDKPHVIPSYNMNKLLLVENDLLFYFNLTSSKKILILLMPVSILQSHDGHFVENIIPGTTYAIFPLHGNRCSTTITVARSYQFTTFGLAVL